MLTLKYKKEPYWLDLIEGLRFYVRPFSSVVLEQARDRVAEIGGDKMGMREHYALLTKEIAKLVVLEWEGVVGGDDAPVPVSEDSVDAALSFPIVCQMFQETYVADGLRMGFEKKGFAPLPNGNLEGAQNIAEAASKSMENDVPPPSESPAPLQ